MKMKKIIYGPDEKIPGESAYDRCSYAGCKNGKYRMGGRKLFLFPGHTEVDRREIWLKNCGNEELRRKADSSIRRSGICSDHFDPSSFTSEKKSALKRYSIPLPNYPPYRSGHVWTNSNSTIVNNSKPSRQAKAKVVNPPERVPRLFEDDDVEEELCGMETNENLSFDMNHEKISCIPDKWMSSNVFLSDDEIGHDSTSSLPHSTLETTKARSEHDTLGVPVNASTLPKTNAPDFSTLTTKMSTVEILRRLNNDINKDTKIEKLTKQNALLRQELRKLKQNVRRWEHRNQAKSLSKKKPLLKNQKRAVMNIVNEMDISPFAKAIISLQLHTRKAPYTEEEKNLAKAFQQYSRADMKRLKTAGCNFPSRSSIKRWLANFDESEDPIASSPSKEPSET